MDNGGNLGVTMPPYSLNPLIGGELVRHIPSDREKIDGTDGIQGILIGKDSEGKLTDDFRVRAIRRKVFQGTKVSRLIEIRCLLGVEVLLQMARGIKPIRSNFHFDVNKPLGQGRARDTDWIPLLPTREHE